MAFADRMTRQPIPHDPAAGAEIRNSFADLGPVLAGLLAGSAGCSPYLRGLMAREATWLRGALCGDPETALEAVLADISALPGDGLAAGLRGAKRRLALLTALADLGGVWHLDQVTAALTRLADGSVAACLPVLVGDEIRRGRLPGATADDAATAAGMVVLAMGKMGAGELNYSSDIDLICLFDDARYPGAVQEARSAFIRVTRRMTALLSDNLQDGYVFRTDLRLRPDASVMPVCLSISAAESYYEAQGRTWERGAYIKARPAAGDLAAGAAFLSALTPFVWRKHLDFAAIQDAHDMRLRIRDHRGLHGPLRIEGHNLKLGQGGIREIEFFTQTQQLIAGGRDVSLRARGTEPALTALAARGWIPAEVARELCDHYRAHRELEHRVQMILDAQTHVMPASADGIARIAHLCGETDVGAFCGRLLDRLARVEDLTDGFFAPGDRAEAGPDLPPAMRAIVARWPGYPALRSDRASAIFRRLRPVLLRSLDRAADPSEALVALDAFLAGLPAGVQLFSLFEANPQLVELIVDICSTAPALARYLARNSAVFDAVIGGDFFAPWPGADALTTELRHKIGRLADYEAALDAARRWMKEWHFRIGVHHLRGLIDADAAGASYADLAAAVVTAIWDVVCADVAQRHGPAPGQGAVVVAMGSLGAGRMHAGSDLDLIVIYDAGPDAVSSGARPMPARAYYARLTQALVTALSAAMAEGRLYAVDMRLRPSGRQGPVATSFEAFRSYHEDEAWTWEHVALTRAWPLAGPGDLVARIEAVRCDILRRKGKGAAVAADIRAMRARVLAAHPVAAAWDARSGPGRLMDVELMAQAMALMSGTPARMSEAQLRAGGVSGLMTPAEAETLVQALALFRRLQTASRLLTDRDPEPGLLGEGGRSFVLREMGVGGTVELTEMIAAEAGRAAARIDAGLGAGFRGDDGPERHSNGGAGRG